MNPEHVLSAYQHELRHLVRAGETAELLPHVTRRSSGYVTAFDLDATNADEVIRREIAHYRSLGREFEWKAFSFDSPPDLLDRLRGAGFTVGEREALVVYDLADGLGRFEAFGCEVRQVEAVDELGDFRLVAEAVFQKDYSFTTDQLAEEIRSGGRGHVALVAYVEGVPVSLGRLYTDPNSVFAGLYGGGTLAEFRGRGCYRAIVAARARMAVAHGARYLIVDALPTSFPILERLGFVQVADTWPCTLAF